MKWIALLSLFPTAIFAAGNPTSWSLLDENDVANLEANRNVSSISALNESIDKGKFEECRETAEKLLPQIEPLAEQQAKGLTEFPDLNHPTSEMDAAVLMLFTEGDACLEMGDEAAAQSIFEKAWRKYPFVRVRSETSGVWMPAKDAYSAWEMIVWMEAIRSRKMDKYPFDPNASIYHDAKGAQGLLGGEPLERAVRKIFATDGPNLLEAAMNQMFTSKDYMNPHRARYLEELIQGLCTPVEEKDERQWEQLQARLEKWARDNPQSSLAKLAMVEFWISYAWHARGDGVASTVTRNGWKLFDERLHNALRVQCQTAIRHPAWYANGLQLGTALGADMDKEAAMCDEGLEKFPWALTIHNSMIMYLLPRWCGRPGDWQRFARSAAKKQGPEIYLGLVRCARNIWHEGDVTKDPLVDWQMVWKGYEARLKHVCTPWCEANEYAQQACQRGDKEAARAAFAYPDSRFHPLYWKNQADYEWWKQWAMQK